MGRGYARTQTASGAVAFFRNNSQAQPAPDVRTGQARGGTHVALGFPLIALLLTGTWLAGDPTPPQLTLWTALALPALCAAYGLFPLTIGARTSVSFEAPTVLLAGLVGGPLAGVLAGIGAGLGDAKAVWRRRSAYAGLAMLHGFAAGQVGAAWRADTLPLAAAVALAALAAIAISSVGLALVQLDRGAWSTRRLTGALLVDTAELVVWAPLLVLLAQSFAAAPGLSTLALSSALGVVAFGAWALTTQQTLVEHERRARLSDPLTGALSRVAFEAALEHEHARVVRGERPAGLILLDVDHFRLVNQEHGHLGGDELLRLVVERVRGAAGSSDIVARWGGDEVCVIAPGIGTLADLEQLCQRLRAAVADSPLASASVTVSVGATLLSDETDPQATFARADEALYVAKRTRNAVSLLSPAAPARKSSRRRVAAAYSR